MASIRPTPLGCCVGNHNLPVQSGVRGACAGKWLRDKIIRIIAYLIPYPTELD